MRTVSLLFFFCVVASLVYTLSHAQEPGDRVLHTIGEIEFAMRLAPSSKFPVGIEDIEIGRVERDFWIAETEVTYGLWVTVLDWAKEYGYTIGRDRQLGRQGGDMEFPKTRSVGDAFHPVTQVPWENALVWTNALTEYHNHLHGTLYVPAYTHNRQIIRDTNDKLEWDNVFFDIGATGFRLPTAMEWELAARYHGTRDAHGAIEYPEGSGMFWAPGDYASGAAGPTTNSVATDEVGWSIANSNRSTHRVGLKPINGNPLGLYDMSGNVAEWCFDKDRYLDAHRTVKGGSWATPRGLLQVGQCSSYPTGLMGDHIGFRIVRLDSERPTESDIYARNEEGWTILMFASRVNNLELAGSLVEEGAEINAKNKDGQTSLMIAVEYNSYEVFRILLEAGADIGIRDDNGWTALMYANYKDHRKINSVLEDVGAKRTWKDRFVVLMRGLGDIYGINEVSWAPRRLMPRIRQMLIVIVQVILTMAAISVAALIQPNTAEEEGCLIKYIAITASLIWLVDNATRAMLPPFLAGRYDDVTGSFILDLAVWVVPLIMGILLGKCLLSFSRTLCWVIGSSVLTVVLHAVFSPLLASFWSWVGPVWNPLVPGSVGMSIEKSLYYVFWHALLLGVGLIIRAVIRRFQGLSRG